RGGQQDAAAIGFHFAVGDGDDVPIGAPKAQFDVVFSGGQLDVAGEPQYHRSGDCHFTLAVVWIGIEQALPLGVVGVIAGHAGAVTAATGGEDGGAGGY